MKNTNKENLLSTQEYKEILQKLHNLSSRLFNKKKVLLMKKGIFRDLIDCKPDALNHGKLKKFFKIYTNKKAYQLLHLKIGEKRYDLEGEIYGQVSKEEVVALKTQQNIIRSKLLKHKMEKK